MTIRFNAPRNALGAVAISLAFSGLPECSFGGEPPFTDDLGLMVDVPTLDGSGNNQTDPTRGQSGTVYPRLGPATYADGIGQPLAPPAPPRYVSNRIYNDGNQNVFSPRGVSHWGVVWGQFLDHTFGLREEGAAEDASLAFDATDPLESFTNSAGQTIPFFRTVPAPGTGADTPRDYVNTVSSYIDAWSVYGGTAERLDWLRAGSFDGDPTNNDAHLLLVDGHLPTAAARPDAPAPAMTQFGIQLGDPSTVVVTGDRRANENLALTSVHTLFAREHNRIVDALPDDMPSETAFQVARRLVIAEQQWITYNEFLPAMGVSLTPYGGYDPDVDASVTNEFATVGYRAHSQIHGEFESAGPAAAYDAATLEAIRATGVETVQEGDEIEFVMPLNVAYGRPDLIPRIGLGPVLSGLASEADYANDELIDNQLRSVLFQVPVGEPDDCLDGPTLPQCFSSVLDLGAADMARTYDHGMPSYNGMRLLFGLPAVASFTELTGESTEELPPGMTIDDPAILDFVQLLDRDGNELLAGSDEADVSTVVAVRQTTTAARLKAIYGTVDELDAFTGMMAEQHVEGSELGPLQLAMWTDQFTRLRDGDRYYYDSNATLAAIVERYGIDYRVTLGDVIAANTDIDRAALPANVFQIDLTATDE